MAGRDSETKGFSLISRKYCLTPSCFSLAQSLESSQLPRQNCLPCCCRAANEIGTLAWGGFEKQRSRGVPGPCPAWLSMRKRSQINLLPPHRCIGRPHNATAENITHNTASAAQQLDSKILISWHNMNVPTPTQHLADKKHIHKIRRCPIMLDG